MPSMRKISRVALFHDHHAFLATCIPGHRAPSIPCPGVLRIVERVYNNPERGHRNAFRHPSWPANPVLEAFLSAPACHYLDDDVPADPALAAYANEPAKAPLPAPLHSYATRSSGRTLSAPTTTSSVSASSHEALAPLSDDDAAFKAVARADDKLLQRFLQGYEGDMQRDAMIALELDLEDVEDFGERKYPFMVDSRDLSAEDGDEMQE